MNNNNFEQQFMQNLQATAAPAPTPVQAGGAGGGGSKVPLITTIVLAVVVLVESIALVLALVSLGQANSGEYYSDEEISDEGDVDGESDYVFNDNYDLVALNVACDNQESGNKIELTTSNGYKLSDASGSVISTGTYSLLRDSIVVVKPSSGSESTLYYDGIVLADGTTIYECGDTAYADE